MILIATHLRNPQVELVRSYMAYKYTYAEPPGKASQQDPLNAAKGPRNHSGQVAPTAAATVQSRRWLDSAAPPNIFMGRMVLLRNLMIKDHYRRVVYRPLFGA